MSVITLFSGLYCHGEEVARALQRRTGYELIEDVDLIREAGRHFNADQAGIAKALLKKPSIFNKFTHERERHLAYLKAVLADILKRDDLLVHGRAGMLIGNAIPHVLRVCLIADIKYRAGVGAKTESISEKDAIRRIREEDDHLVPLAEHVYETRDPWSPSLHDIVIPMDTTGVEEALDMILSNLGKDAVRVTPESRKAAEDFSLAALIGLKLALAGHNVDVTVRDGDATLVINKNVLMLSSLQDELKRLVQPVPGVKTVEAKPGPGFYRTDIYRRYDFDVPPSKVLLVDDERKYVQTLSERLQVRNLGAAVVYGGEEALSVLEDEIPEVMVLDLKMPGVDGTEVLRRVRKEHPEVQVIILTGHGSEEARGQCLELGAYAYVEKPVDADKLTELITAARQRLKKRADDEDIS